MVYHGHCQRPLTRAPTDLVGAQFGTMSGPSAIAATTRRCRSRLSKFANCWKYIRRPAHGMLPDRRRSRIPRTIVACEDVARFYATLLVPLPAGFSIAANCKYIRITRFLLLDTICKAIDSGRGVNLPIMVRAPADACVAFDGPGKCRVWSCVKKNARGG